MEGSSYNNTSSHTIPGLRIHHHEEKGSSHVKDGSVRSKGRRKEVVKEVDEEEDEEEGEKEKRSKMDEGEEKEDGEEMAVVEEGEEDDDDMDDYSEEEEEETDGEVSTRALLTHCYRAFGKDSGVFDVWAPRRGKVTRRTW